MRVQSPNVDAALLHLDEWLIVLNKPSGLAVHPGWAPRGEPTALVWARRLAKRHVYPVHRLDRGTSGALLFALDSSTARTISEGFARGEVSKRYVALVRGVSPDEGVVDHPIPRREGGPRVPAVTRFRRVQSCTRDRCSLVEAWPQTGRLHQVRRHLKHISHPLVGDVRYGKGDINRRFRSQWNLHRLALHHLRMVLPHPHTGEALDLYAPIPADLADPLRALGLSAPSLSRREPAE